jgi:hypothetical protein
MNRIKDLALALYYFLRMWYHISIACFLIVKAEIKHSLGD